jgi:ketosteroid isomerase-like protein
MKPINLVLGLILSFSCNPSSEGTSPKLDTEAELAAIEQVRHTIEEAIKESDLNTIMKYSTDDAVTIGPGSADWSKMYANSRPGRFPYDSIIMSPRETVILSDSMAYDFGTSRVFHTDSLGKVIELKDTFLVLLKKGKDGTWRMYREVASARVN